MRTTTKDRIKEINGREEIRINELKKLRIRLHQTLVLHMKDIGLVTSANVIEDFKRWYLFTFWRVETSRALSELQLYEAIEHVKGVPLKEAVDGIMHKYKRYASEKELVKCTQNQINAIYAICIGSLKKTKEWMFNYIYSTLHRSGHKFNISFAEADTVIKRLEKFEAKVLRAAK